MNDAEDVEHSEQRVAAVEDGCEGGVSAEGAPACASPQALGAVSREILNAF